MHYFFPINLRGIREKVKERGGGESGRKTREPRGMLKQENRRISSFFFFKFLNNFRVEDLWNIF